MTGHLAIAIFREVAKLMCFNVGIAIYAMNIENSLHVGKKLSVRKVWTQRQLQSGLLPKFPQMKFNDPKGTVEVIMPKA